MTISDFKKDTSLTSIPENSSNLTNLDLEPVIAYGRLRALFGEPNYETQNFEDAYSYILFVESESSEKIYLEVYEGSSGPAIGGLNNAESLQAAETLKKLIEDLRKKSVALQKRSNWKNYIASTVIMWKIFWERLIYTMIHILEDW